MVLQQQASKMPADFPTSFRFSKSELWVMVFDVFRDPRCVHKRLEAMNTPWRLDPERKKRTSFGLGYNIVTRLNIKARCLHSMSLVGRRR